MKMIEGASPGFVIGEDADLQEWVVHLSHPRFAAKVRPVAEFTEDELEQGSANLFYFGDLEEQEALVGFIWMDPEPQGQELRELLERAADFIEVMSES